MKTILLLSMLLSSPIIAQSVQSDTANVQSSHQRQQSQRDTVWVMQQPAKEQPQRIQNEYSISTGTQTLWIVAIALSLVSLLLVL